MAAKPRSGQLGVPPFGPLCSDRAPERRPNCRQLRSRIDGSPATGSTEDWKWTKPFSQASTGNPMEPSSHDFTYSRSVERRGYHLRLQPISCDQIVQRTSDSSESTVQPSSTRAHVLLPRLEHFPYFPLTSNPLLELRVQLHQLLLLRARTLCQRLPRPF